MRATSAIIMKDIDGLDQRPPGSHSSCNYQREKIILDGAVLYLGVNKQEL
jgi:hypothetical protein